MALRLLTGPQAEPLSVAEAKAHLRIDHGDEDVLISSLIIAARLHVEVALSRALITQSWAFFLDGWPPNAEVTLPFAPLQSVEGVNVYDAESVGTALSPQSYYADTVSEPGRVVVTSPSLLVSPGRAANGVEVRFTAGFGDDAEDVPQAIRQALLMLVAHWYERREPVTLGETSARVPETASSLLSPYKMVRL